VEASLNSGALITADFALSEGREVLAVPGSILAANSAGTNRLIRAGAAAVTSVEDVLEEVGLNGVQTGGSKQCESRITEKLNREQKILFERLSMGPALAEELARDCGMKVGMTLAALSSMEVMGLVKRASGGFYNGVASKPGS